MTTGPTHQQADQTAAQPTAQPIAPPTVPPASANADQQHASSASDPRRLVRRSDDRWLGGVCSGLAAHLGLDPTLVRLLTVLLTVLGFGSVIIVYLVAWLIVPTSDPASDPDVAVLTPPAPA